MRVLLKCAIGQIAVLIGLLLLAHPLGDRARAEVWVFEDSQGRLHFSDTPQHSGYRRMARAEKRPAREHRVVHVSGVSSHWDRAIARAGRRYSVDPGLVKAVIHVESRFDTTAVSPKGALGLMQLMPRTAALVGVDDAFDPWQNISGGTRYLGYLLKRFKGDLELSLAAYNAGESTVRRYGGMPPYRETQRYVKRVLDLRRRYDADFR
jgi:soluble lytic murein transglycosylase-like protein